MERIIELPKNIPMRPLIFAFLFGIAFFYACRPAAPSEEQTKPDADLTEFYAFYQSFHMDSAFQMDHIIFPLEGLPANVDSETLERRDFKWERENWNLHYPIDFETSEFRREIIPVSEDIVVEKIVHRNGQVGMLRRFAKIGDDWYLIYFADMNRIKQ